MIALIDYGAGNVRSVHKALAAAGAKVQLVSDPDLVSKSQFLLDYSIFDKTIDYRHLISNDYLKI